MSDRPQATAFLRPPWQPGQSGNKGAKAYKGLLRHARIKSLDMLKVAIRCAEDETAPWPARVSAALAVLDRAWGKPKEHLQLDGDGLTTLQIRFVDERSDGPIVDAEAFQLTFNAGVSEMGSDQPSAQPVDNPPSLASDARSVHKPVHKSRQPVADTSEEREP